MTGSYRAAAAVGCGQGVSSDWQGRPLEGQRAAHSAPLFHFFSETHETILKPRGCSQSGGMTSAGTAVRMNSMVELVVAVVGLASAGIFLAHAIDAYQAENTGPKPSSPHGRPDA